MIEKIGTRPIFSVAGYIFLFILCCIVNIETKAATPQTFFASNAQVPNFTTKGYILYSSGNMLKSDSGFEQSPNYINDYPATAKCHVGWRACVSAWIVNTNRTNGCGGLNEIKMNSTISQSGVALTPYFITIDASLQTQFDFLECPNPAIKVNYMITCMPPNSANTANVCVIN